MADAVQVAGAVMVLVAFVLAQLDVLDEHAYRYLLPNLVGSGAMTFTAVVSGDWGFVFLEGTWAVVSFHGLLTRLRPNPEAAR